jgi:hypothetical protein
MKMVPVREPMVKAAAAEYVTRAKAAAIEGRTAVTKTATMKGRAATPETAAMEAASTAVETTASTAPKSPASAATAAVKAAASASLGALNFGRQPVGSVFRCRNVTRTEWR